MSPSHSTLRASNSSNAFTGSEQSDDMIQYRCSVCSRTFYSSDDPVLCLACNQVLCLHCSQYGLCPQHFAQLSPEDKTTLKSSGQIFGGKKTLLFLLIPILIQVGALLSIVNFADDLLGWLDWIVGLSVGMAICMLLLAKLFTNSMRSAQSPDLRDQINQMLKKYQFLGQ